MGNMLRTLMADEKPAIVAMMEEEWTKLGDSKPPAPVRGLRVFIKKAGSAEEDQGVGQPEPEVTAPDPDELVDRANIR